jgi:uncharacterized membrane protein
MRSTPRAWPLVYIAALACFLAIDAAWISLVALPLFKADLAAILRPEPWPLPAIIFYLGYPALLLALALPSKGSDGKRVVLLRGAMVGLVAYGTYELTNLSTLAAWTPRLAILDIMWGGALSLVVALFGYSVRFHAWPFGPRAE